MSIRESVIEKEKQSLLTLVRAKPKRKRRGMLSVEEVEQQFDATIEDNAERRKAFADCMGMSLKQAIAESKVRCLPTTGGVAMGKDQMNKVCRKVAHAQLSDSSARSVTKNSASPSPNTASGAFNMQTC